MEVIYRKDYDFVDEKTWLFETEVVTEAQIGESKISTGGKQYADHRSQTRGPQDLCHPVSNDILWTPTLI